MSAVLAPAGWGYPPRYPLDPVSAKLLPELPLLRILPLRERNAAIVATLRDLPYLRYVLAEHVATRYELTNKFAWELIQRAKSKDFSTLGARRASHTNQARTA